MKTMRQNDRWRWLTAGAVAVCLLAFTLLIALLAWQGMRAFWPQRVDAAGRSDHGAAGRNPGASAALSRACGER